MAAYFFDTSAIVKRYVTETGTNWVAVTIDPTTGHNIYIARITLVELVSAVSRRCNTGTISVADAFAAIHQFRSDFAHQYEVVELTKSVFDDAADLAENHVLRAYDAVQLSAVVDVQNDRTVAGMSPITLVSADLDLNAAAMAVGILVDDPNSHP